MTFVIKLTKILDLLNVRDHEQVVYNMYLGKM